MTASVICSVSCGVHLIIPLKCLILWRRRSTFPIIFPAAVVDKLVLDGSMWLTYDEVPLAAPFCSICSHGTFPIFL